jgi:hypothetical protein
LWSLIVPHILRHYKARVDLVEDLVQKGEQLGIAVANLGSSCAFFLGAKSGLL